MKGFLLQPTMVGKTCASLAQATTPTSTPTPAMDVNTLEDYENASPTEEPSIQDTTVECISTCSNTPTHSGADVGTTIDEAKQLLVTPALVATEEFNEKESCEL